MVLKDWRTFHDALCVMIKYCVGIQFVYNSPLTIFLHPLDNCRLWYFNNQSPESCFLILNQPTFFATAFSECTSTVHSSCSMHSSVQSTCTVHSSTNILALLKELGLLYFCKSSFLLPLENMRISWWQV